MKTRLFHFSGKSQTIGGFYLLPTIPDFADISDIRQRSVPDFPDYKLFICDRGTGAQQFRGLVMSEIHRRRTPTSPTVQLSGMFADYCRNLGHVGKIETLPILQICPVHLRRLGISTISSFH